MRLTQTQRETLERQDARFSGLPAGIPPEKESVLAHLRNIARLLKYRRTPSPCSRAVSYVNALYDRSIPDAAKQRLACRHGCAHCCHQPVVVYAPELFLLLAQIRSQEGMADRLLAAAEAARGQTRGKSAPCPLLQDNACGVYAARPLSCRAFASMNVNDCISAFRYLSPPKVMAPGAYGSLRDMCRMMVLAAMKAGGYPVQGYELNIKGLAALLGQDNAEKRWLRDEDVMGGLDLVPPDLQPDVLEKIKQMSVAIAPAL